MCFTSIGCVPARVRVGLRVQGCGVFVCGAAVVVFFVLLRTTTTPSEADLRLG